MINKSFDSLLLVSISDSRLSVIVTGLSLELKIIVNLPSSYRYIELTNVFVKAFWLLILSAFPFFKDVRKNFISAFKYLKPNRKVSAGGYAKYIATREGVEKIDSSQKFAPATAKQKNLIEKILKDFPDSKDMFEYSDYIEKKKSRLGI